MFLYSALKYWKLIGVGFLLVAILGKFYFMSSEIDKLNKTIISLNVVITQKIQDLDNLSRELNSTKTFNQAQSSNFTDTVSKKDEIILMLRTDLNKSFNKKPLEHTKIVYSTVKIQNCDLNLSTIDYKNDSTGKVLESVGF